MVPCPNCRHSNFDGFANCSRCGAPLAAGAPVGPGPGGSGGVRAGGAGLGGGGGIGMDEYQRVMADRAAKQKRSRMIIGAVVVLAVGGGGFFVMRERRKTAAGQVILDAGGRFAEKDKGEMGAFWSCVMSSEVDVGMFNSADQIQQRVESAYFTQQKTFSEHLTSECVPKMERGRAAMAALTSETPDELKPALDKYLATLPRLQAGIESYAEKIKGRSAVKDVDGTIQEVGGAFSADPTVESTAFEKFLVCAIPDLDKKKDIQGVLEFLAATCKTDAVKFMTRVRAECGPMIQNLNKDGKPAPSKTFKANAKKLYEEDQRQLQAWEYCAKRSRKGKKVLDLEEFLNAAGDYMETRAGVVQVAREENARITGKPLEVAKKKEAPGEPPAP